MARPKKSLVTRDYAAATRLAAEGKTEASQHSPRAVRGSGPGFLRLTATCPLGSSRDL